MVEALSLAELFEASKKKVEGVVSRVEGYSSGSDRGDISNDLSLGSSELAEMMKVAFETLDEDDDLEAEDLLNDLLKAVRDLDNDLGFVDPNTLEAFFWNKFVVDRATRQIDFRSSVQTKLAKGSIDRMNAIATHLGWAELTAGATKTERFADKKRIFQDVVSDFSSKDEIEGPAGVWKTEAEVLQSFASEYMAGTKFVFNGSPLSEIGPVIDSLRPLAGQIELGNVLSDAQVDSIKDQRAKIFTLEKTYLREPKLLADLHELSFVTHRLIHENNVLAMGGSSSSYRKEYLRPSTKGVGDSWGELQVVLGIFAQEIEDFETAGKMVSRNISIPQEKIDEFKKIRKRFELKKFDYVGIKNQAESAGNTEDFSEVDELAMVLQDHVNWMDRVIAKAESLAPATATGGVGGGTVGAESGSFALKSAEHRENWTILDHVAYLEASLQATVGQSGKAQEVATDLRRIVGEFITDKVEQQYWYAKVAIYDMLIKAESPSGRDYSIQQDNISGAPTFKFERDKMLQGLLYNPYFGDRIRITRSIVDNLLQDRQGPFAAKKLSPMNVDGFMSEVGRILQDDYGVTLLPKPTTEAERIKQDELAKTDRSVLPQHVFETALLFPQSTAARDTYFIDDTAEAVTKGFGGTDKTHIYKPEATVSYDIQRYGREPKAAFLMLLFAKLPNHWARRAAWNNRYLDDPVKDRAKKEKAAKIEGKNRIKKADAKTHEIREWWYTFFPEEDWKRAVEMARVASDSLTEKALVMGAEEGELIFQQSGASFPTFYEIMQKTEKDKLKPDGSIEVGFELQRYFVALGGWEKALELTFKSPEERDADAALRAIDDFNGALGKAKIVPGRHHHMMNFLALVFYAQVAKRLKPHTEEEYQKFKNQALEKVDAEDTSPSGGGILPHVKLFLTQLLESDLLKRKQLSSFAVGKYEATEERGKILGKSKPGIMLRARATLAAGKKFVEAVQEGGEGGYEIPKGPIEWGEKTNVKEGESKKS